MPIPNDIVEEIRSRSDIVGVIGDYVSLKKRGRNWLGSCPFHAEKTPSFTVSPEKGMFYCFGCGAGGNVFTFVMRMENLGFEETVRRLAERVGVVIPERSLSGPDKNVKEKRERIGEACEEATQFYSHILLKQPEGEEGRLYLRKREYDINIAKAYRLGWAPREWGALIEHLGKKGFSQTEIEEAGLASKRDSGGYYDRFRGRVVFPIMSVQERVLGFGGRLVGDEEGPKYLNSPETAIYRKSEILYGLHAAKSAISSRNAAIICEGYFDCLALHKHGFTNAVATCGTALTLQHVLLLKRYTINLYPLFDADEAGKKAAERALEVILGAPARAYFVALPSGDPDSFLIEEGAEKMAVLIDNAPPLLQFTIDKILANAGVSVESRQEALKKTAELFAKMSDRQAMEIYLRDTAQRLLPNAGGSAEQLLREEITRMRKISAGGLYQPDKEKKRVVSTAPTPELYLVALCMNEPEARERLKQNPDVIAEFEDEDKKKIARDLIAASGASAILDGIDPAIADILTGLTMKSQEGRERNVVAEFDELTHRIKLNKIARNKREIQAKLAIAKPEEQTELLRRKSELLEIERNLLENESGNGAE